MTSARRYARGSKAWGECQRSGQRYLADELIEDGHIPGLLVHPDWYEPPHPREEIPIPGDDPQLIRYPSPKLDKWASTATIHEGLDLLTGLEVVAPFATAQVGQAVATGVVVGIANNVTDTQGNNITDAQGNQITEAM